MKSRIMILAAAAFLAYAAQPTPLATAQAAPDYAAIKSTLIDMKQDINRMYVLVEHHEAGKGVVAGLELSYTEDHKSALLAEYNALKAALAAKFQALP